MFNHSVRLSQVASTKSRSITEAIRRYLSELDDLGGHFTNGSPDE